MTIRDVLLTELLAATRPVYPQPHQWDTTVEYMKNDPIDWEIVSKLISILESGENFRENIRVGLDGDFETEPVSSLYIGDGTHRMVAHILHGSDYVTADFEEPQITESDNSRLDDNEETYIAYTTKVILDDGTPDNLEDLLMHTLRSFEVDKDMWVTSSVMFGSGNAWEFSWDIDTADAALLEDINAVCIERIATLTPLKPQSVTTYREEINY